MRTQFHFVGLLGACGRGARRHGRMRRHHGRSIVATRRGPATGHVLVQDARYLLALPNRALVPRHPRQRPGRHRYRATTAPITRASTPSSSTRSRRTSGAAVGYLQVTR